MRLLLLSILTFISLAVLSQNVSYYVKQGELAADSGNFALASEYYLHAIKINPNIINVQYKYSQALRKSHNYQEAARWYRKVYRKGDDDFPLARFHYASCMKMQGEYASAFSGFHRFYKMNRLNENLRDYVMVAKYEKYVCDRLKELKEPNKQQDVRLLQEPFSSELGEFSPVQLDETHVLLSTYRSYTNDSITSVSNGILLITYDEDKNPLQVDTLLIDDEYSYSLGSGKSKEHIYFSKCALADSTVNCKIFEASIKDRQLSNINELKGDVNKHGSNSRHPSYVKFHNFEYLLFASDRSGGFGKNDIWYCMKNEQNVFSDCKNAGKFINSIEDEVSPFFYTPDTFLYFSSKWHGSKGGFDIFSSYGNFNFWTTPLNAGKSINSSYDDLYYVINANTRSSFFVSNRAKDKYEVNCCHDVYTYDLPFSRNDSIREVQRIAREIERKESIRTELKLLTPLDLYFQNDSPDPGSRDTATQANLVVLLDEYINEFETYQLNYSNGLSGKKLKKADDELNEFFIENIEAGKDDLLRFASLLELALQNGDQILITVQAYTSPLNSQKYNEQLAKRRISSLMNFMHAYEDGKYRSYFSSGQLIIEQKAYGESKAPDTISDDIKDLRNSVYSPAAAHERRIQIEAINVKRE